MNRGAGEDSMELYQAQKHDFARIVHFYQNVIEKTIGMSDFCRWSYGDYPTDDLLVEHIQQGDMYLVEQDGEILSALVLLPYQEENFTWDIPWNAALEDGDVATVHLLCVNPRMQRRGIAGRTMEAAIRMARDMGKKAVRLDTLACNLPARRLCASLGFTEVEAVRWDFSNVGLTDIVLYEYLL